MIHPAPKPAPREKKPRKRLQAHKRLTSKTPLKKVNRKRLDKRTKQYKAYMASWDWKMKRIACLTRDNWTCQKCGWKDEKACFIVDIIAPRQLHAHHLTTVRFGHERLEDLITLCDECHMREHATRFIKPRFARLRFL